MGKTDAKNQRFGTQDTKIVQKSVWYPGRPQTQYFNNFFNYYFHFSSNNLSPTGPRNILQIQAVKVWTHNLSKKKIFIKFYFFPS